MPGPDTMRLVLIRCKLKDAPNETRMGTGYFVTHDLALTASHVVDPRAESIEVRQESSGGWTRAERVVWRDDKLDAALVRVVGVITDSAPEVRWGSSTPEEHLEWTSTAYPIAATQRTNDDIKFKTAGLRGTYHPQGGGGQGERELDLTVDDATSAKEWGGISGAPVFIGDELIGIVKTVPEAFSGKRLAGVPVEALFRDSLFHMAVAPPWLGDLPSDLWVLVLLAESDRDDLEHTVSAAILRRTKELTAAAGQPVTTKPVTVRVTEALDSPARWLQLVRALCAAPVVVADVTDFQPAMMLFLGIRAVVRRGITITTTAKTIDETELSQLPFNIQETKLVFHGGGHQISDPNHSLNILGTAVRDGLQELRSHPGYLDLPAYDAVRQPLPDLSSVTARDHVLVLCSFHQEYSRHWLSISDTLAVHFPARAVRRMTDVSSPRLTGQALYEHIRWVTTCVADWTHWRPNVFFEIGVRLACSDIPSVFLIERAEVDAAISDTLKQKTQLLRLLHPATYTIEQTRRDLRDALQRHDLIVKGLPPEQLREEVPYDGTYRMAVDAYDWQQERFTLKPHELLRWAAEVQLGKDPQRSGVSPVLYSTNPAFAQVLRRSVEERWVAAWYYLRHRYSQEEFDTNVQLRTELKDVGETVLLWLSPESPDHNLRRLRIEIIDYIDDSESV